MKNTASPAKRDLWVLRGSLAAVLLCLVPHLITGTDIYEGLRIGASATTNTLSSSSAVLLGHYNTAHGNAQSSLAVGTYNILGSPYGGYVSGAVAVGSNNTANNAGAVAVGASNSAAGSNAFASGHLNSVSGQNAAALGSANTVTGQAAFAAGASHISAGNYSTALGYRTDSPGLASLAAGDDATSLADMSQAFGINTWAWSYGSLVLGRFNAPVGDEDVPAAAARTTWRPDDPLFVVGNGESATQRSNALVIKKNGEVDIPRIKRRGDIEMGEFGD